MSELKHLAETMIKAEIHVLTCFGCHGLSEARPCQASNCTREGLVDSRCGGTGKLRLARATHHVVLPDGWGMTPGDGSSQACCGTKVYGCQGKQVNG